MDSDDDSRRDRGGKFHSERGNSMDQSQRRNNSGNHRDRYEPSRKRPREDDTGRGRDSRNTRGSRSDDANAPIIQTFKQWVVQQADDLVSPDGATTGYTDYKKTERKRHVEQFFVEHKEEEWFREKYHPEDNKNSTKLKCSFLKERFAAWKQLYDAGVMKNIQVDLENQSKLKKIMDASIILMEGGSVEDAVNFIHDGAISMKSNASATAKKEEAKDEEKPKEEQENEEGKTDDGEDKSMEDEGEAVPGATEDGELMDTKKPKEYKSLFIKTLPPNISKTDLIATCRRYAGFVRVAFESIPDDYRFRRRAWITFEDSVNIKDICWNLNNIRLKELELGAVIMKDPASNRIRDIPGLSNHAPIAFRDLRLAVKCCELRDAQLINCRDSTLEETKETKEDAENDEVAEEDTKSAAFFWDNDVNPILAEAKKFIESFDDMYEEKMAEILKYKTTKNVSITEEFDAGTPEGDAIEYDLIDDIFNVFDPLLMYLRIVHAVDFYCQGDYSNYEDEHPSRCGLLHVRGVVPTRGSGMAQAKGFVTKFAEKTEEGLLKDTNKKLSDEEAQVLGFKNIDDEVEKFIKDNTQKIDADKFLCPLSGKKFRGHDYVRKHIFNKHGEKVDVVKRDCEYFNAFVVDKFKRGPPEPKFNLRSANTNTRRDDDRPDRRNGHGGYHQQRQNSQTDLRQNIDRNRGYPRRSDDFNNRNNNNNNRNNSYNERPKPVYTQAAHVNTDQINKAGGGREVIDYRDLDAPADVDMFG